jgi:mRNA interferase MazF
VPQTGDVVTVEFPSARITKRRPAVVLSSATYHQTRPDVILGLVTSNVSAATAPSDCALQDWRAAGLRQPSAFRAFLITMPAASVKVIGHLTDRDWQAVQTSLCRALVLIPAGKTQ